MKKRIKNIIYRLLYDAIYDTVETVINDTKIYILVFITEKDEVFVENWPYIPLIGDKIMVFDRKGDRNVVLLIKSKKIQTKNEVRFSVEFIEEL